MNHSSKVFSLSLGMTLTLEAEGKKADVLSSHIEKLDLQLHSYGHTCQIQFSAFADEKMDALFPPPKVMKATLAIKAIDDFSQLKPGAPLIELKGIVTNREFRRVPSPMGDEGKAYREYKITFCDKAKVTWSEHFPINLYIDTAMKDIFEKQKNPEVGTIKYDCSALETPFPVTSFCLDYKEGQAKDRQVSFYSFLTWYLLQINAIWAYDYKKDAYSILSKKAAEGKPLELMEGWLDPPVCIFPSPPRFNGKIIKPNFDSVESEDKENTDAFKAVLRQTFNPANYTSFPEQAPEAVQSILVPEQNQVEVEFKTFPHAKISIDQLLPGSLVSFKGDKEGNWSQDTCYKGKTFRVQSLYLFAQKQRKSQEVKEPVEGFDVQLKIKLEDKEETFVERPSFIPPTYPFAIQGTIFSDVGDKEQSTFKLQEDKEKGIQAQYLVKVPLSGDDKKVVVPFTPDFISGQYYFPFTKGQRVELSMYFHTAKILRLCDWQPLARLPVGTQANQIVMASNGKDKFVIVKHEFVNGSDSVLTIQQSSSPTLTQTIQIKEGDMEMTVMEKDKTALTISMKKESGLVIQLDDKASGVTQKTSFDKKAMTHTCKGSAGTSIMEQKPDAIAFQCDKYTIKAKDIIFDAANSISQTGANKVNFESKVANISAPSIKLGP